MTEGLLFAAAAARLRAGKLLAVALAAFRDVVVTLIVPG